ncbi:hypothetical protein TNCV_1903121 [Trichonephila clavipes]|nr:hypothetical protein TNCV_1903121 [Trichonephila clavipes]
MAHLLSTTKSSQSAESLLEVLSSLSTLKTTCENHGRRKNVARELTSTKKVAIKIRRYGVLAKGGSNASTSKHNTSGICPVCGVNYYDETQEQE